jgi:hypothetical protein
MRLILLGNILMDMSAIKTEDVTQYFNGNQQSFYNPTGKIFFFFFW